LPTAVATEQYREELFETYKEYDDCEELVETALEQQLYRYFMEYSSVNAVLVWRWERERASMHGVKI
jgi:hypothetical protein